MPQTTSSSTSFSTSLPPFSLCLPPPMSILLLHTSPHQSVHPGCLCPPSRRLFRNSFLSFHKNYSRPTLLVDRFSLTLQKVEAIQRSDGPFLLPPECPFVSTWFLFISIFAFSPHIFPSLSPLINLSFGQFGPPFRFFRIIFFLFRFPKILASSLPPSIPSSSFPSLLLFSFSAPKCSIPFQLSSFAANFFTPTKSENRLDLTELIKDQKSVSRAHPSRPFLPSFLSPKMLQNFLAGQIPLSQAQQQQIQQQQSQQQMQRSTNTADTQQQQASGRRGRGEREGIVGGGGKGGHRERGRGGKGGEKQKLTILMTLQLHQSTDWHFPVSTLQCISFISLNKFTNLFLGCKYRFTSVGKLIKF